MAVLVEFTIPGATPEQLYAVEELTRKRGEAAGRPPYDGCMFFAVTADSNGTRSVSAWRTEAEFRAVLETMLGPDLKSVGLSVSDIAVAPVLAMAIPGAFAR